MINIKFAQIVITLVVALVVWGCGEVKEILEDTETVIEDTIDIVDLNDSTKTTTTTIEPDPTNPTCSGTNFPPDGANGFLWKPESESNYNLVVLLPESYHKKFEYCTVFDGYVADPLTWAGVHNGQRQHWRASRPGSAYAAPALLVCNDGSQDCAWQVSTPWARVD